MTAPTSLVPFPPIPSANQQRAISDADPNAVLAAATLAATPAPKRPQTPPPVSLPGKEAAPLTQPEQPMRPPETAQLVELQETEPLPEEVEGWLQKLDQEGDIKLDKPITHDGNILLSDSTEAQVVKEKTILPMTQAAVNQGLTQTVTDSARWLAEWCVRLIKVMKDRVKYAPEEVKSS